MNAAKLGAMASLLSFGVLLSGCAIRPLPENVTPRKEHTYKIAMRIRCEARDAVYQQLKRFMNDPSNAVPRAVAERFELGGPETVLGDSYAGVPERLMDELRRYATSAIVYDFRFDMSEQNNLSGGIGVGDRFFNRTFTGNVSGKNNLKRTDVRIFRLTDTLKSLYSPHMHKYCDAAPGKPKFSMDEDYQYPIVGKLNIDEIVHTFWRFDRDDLLRLRPDQGSNAFTDQIEFRTELESTINPVLAATDPSQVFRIIKVESGLTNNRTDTHTVIIGIATGDRTVAAASDAASSKGEGKPAANGKAAVKPRSSRSSTLERLVSPEATAKAVEDANRAVDRLILREDAFRLGNRLDRLDDILR